jgi:hypothetical protein
MHLQPSRKKAVEQQRWLLAELTLAERWAKPQEQRGTLLGRLRTLLTQRRTLAAQRRTPRQLQSWQTLPHLSKRWQ